MPLEVSWTVPADRFFHFIHLTPFSTLVSARFGTPWPIMDYVGTTFLSSHAPIGCALIRALRHPVDPPDSHRP